MNRRLYKPLLVVALLAFLLGYVWERVDIVRVGYKLEQLKAQKLALERERDELSVRLAALSSPDRIARAARERLGLAPPQPGQVVVVHRADSHQPDLEGGPSIEVQVARRESR